MIFLIRHRCMHKDREQPQQTVLFFFLRRDNNFSSSCSFLSKRFNPLCASSSLWNHTHPATKKMARSFNPSHLHLVFLIPCVAMLLLVFTAGDTHATCTVARLNLIGNCNANETQVIVTSETGVLQAPSFNSSVAGIISL